jgi:hypothetical protein
MPIKVRAPLACRIARIDRDRFNEAVARGDYPCVAKPGHGRTREFTIHEVIGLFIYGRLIDSGVSSRKAGHLACDTARLALTIDGFENEVGISFAYNAAGLVHECASMNVALNDSLTPERLAQIKSRRAEIETATRFEITSPTIVRLAGAGDVIRQDTWQLGAIRRLIEDAIEEYRNTLGEEETIG